MCCRTYDSEQMRSSCGGSQNTAMLSWVQQFRPRRTCSSTRAASRGRHRLRCLLRANRRPAVGFHWVRLGAADWDVLLLGGGRLRRVHVTSCSRHTCFDVVHCAAPFCTLASSGTSRVESFKVDPPPLGPCARRGAGLALAQTRAAHRAAEARLRPRRRCQPGGAAVAVGSDPGDPPRWSRVGNVKEVRPGPPGPIDSGRHCHSVPL